MRHRHTLAAATLALALAAACGDATAPRGFDATGSWSGQVDGATVHLDLAQQGQQLSGTGAVVTSRNIPVSAQGTAQVTSVSLTLTAPGFEDVVLEGGFTGRDAITAYMAGSGFFGEQILLRRE